MGANAPPNAAAAAAPVEEDREEALAPPGDKAREEYEWGAVEREMAAGWPQSARTSVRLNNDLSHGRTSVLVNLCTFITCWRVLSSEAYIVKSAEPVGAALAAAPPAPPPIPKLLGGGEPGQTPPSPLSLHTADFHVPASVAPLLVDASPPAAAAAAADVLLKMLPALVVPLTEVVVWEVRESSSSVIAPETFAREEDEEGEKMVEVGLERVLDFNLLDLPPVEGTHISTFMRNSRAGGGK